MSDFNLADQGSLFILTPITQAGRDWSDEYLPDDAMMWGKGIVIEPRYVEAIVLGIVADGLEIEGE